ncbi:MAG: sulfotransferase domain-containing protein [Gammaproteobacteria bacterium]|nr:sulfotransferase domain-containing protein [Gammaproteobacteria bacterium]NIR81916.1 sulfotransferase domain-containing protein [Gammaproteobacteria bacterium]NIR88748.1 sulfotransferase domain-containing protein [Gammaproteobacteria bacterium]NIU03024.1 sulfotransferase domain-containing protein [Gammaproteobacteria bacterium]NIV50545.1 hypothetical protein [Gammaproteobacteria bacterium]
MTLVPDRYKHAAIIASTAPLPKRLRVPARLQLLSRFHRAKARRADVLVVVHPKCGGTWLRVMLYRLYQNKYGLRSRRVFKTDELRRENDALPRFLVSNGHYSYEGVIEEAARNSNAGLVLDDKKVIFLARHPCDIVVSWYLQLTKRTKAYKRELINHSLRSPVRRGALSLYEFAVHDEIGLPGLIEYLNTWAYNLSQLPQSLLIRYEDLRAEPADTLRRIADFIGEPFSGAEMEEAVAFASFDNLKALERANYFRNASLTLRNANDPDMFKVRRGKVGGYRDHFTPEQLAQIDELVRNRLSPVFGYGESPAQPARAAQEA